MVRLSGRNVDELLAGARIDPTEAKRDPLDFAMWKEPSPGEPSWESPWGPGALGGTSSALPWRWSISEQRLTSTAAEPT